ncbi:thiamine phosphate synthase [Siccirubricoccus phaeus]|uniref:thiamine phosphate synthase n=1 Tax=Siccirubricoccus phaeus TaxID=2595053 RepID=UPI0011F3E50B|nr:thiamine phosphate synthase [Siccirubricoccus phaeus]
MRLSLAAAARRLRPVPGLPRLWLLSDAARLPDPLPLAARLPPGAAVVARDLPAPRLAALAALARRRRLQLLVAAEGRLALRHAAGLLLPDRRPTRHLLPFLLARRPGRALLVAAHGRSGLARARRLHAEAVLLSPAFPTLSHPGAPALGPLRWAALAARAGRPVLALGGVTGRSARRLPRRTAGLAAIGGFV